MSTVKPLSDYPAWAPQCLVRLHRIMLERPIREDDPEEHVARLRQQPEFAAFRDDDEHWEAITRSLYRDHLFLPDRQKRELLQKLLTDVRMRNVWATLGKRLKEDKDYKQFFLTCQSAISGWRSRQKLTPSQRRQFYLELREKANELGRMMVQADARQISSYLITQLLKDDDLDTLIELLPVDMSAHTDGYIKNRQDLRSYIRFTLSDVLPDILTILTDIGDKALDEADREPAAKKPNSDKAHVHYFVRSLSRHLRTTCGQPLHDAVAITACVALDEDGIDADYVRKIVAPEGF